MEDWAGIYKGLRLPILGVVLLYIIYYVYKPKNKKHIEQAKFSMLNDELDPNLSEEFEKKEMNNNLKQ
ncbi:MAG: cbb3-type cytochrome c oxidase subunit 3 [Spirochaetia bacterium]|nr:cbb3-type cytochrome c oxidase subunit 3 [Spirochaetia bacterium]